MSSLKSDSKIEIKEQRFIRDSFVEGKGKKQDWREMVSYKAASTLVLTYPTREFYRCDNQSGLC